MTFKRKSKYLFSHKRKRKKTSNSGWSELPNYQKRNIVNQEARREALTNIIFLDNIKEKEIEKEIEKEKNVERYHPLHITIQPVGPTGMIENTKIW